MRCPDSSIRAITYRPTVFRVLFSPPPLATWALGLSRRPPRRPRSANAPAQVGLARVTENGCSA